MSSHSLWRRSWHFGAVIVWSGSQIPFNSLSYRGARCWLRCGVWLTEGGSWSSSRKWTHLRLTPAELHNKCISINEIKSDATLQNMTVFFLYTDTEWKFFWRLFMLVTEWGCSRNPLLSFCYESINYFSHAADGSLQNTKVPVSLHHRLRICNSKLYSYEKTQNTNTFLLSTQIVTHSKRKIHTLYPEKKRKDNGIWGCFFLKYSADGTPQPMS